MLKFSFSIDNGIEKNLEPSLKKIEFLKSRIKNYSYDSDYAFMQLPYSLEYYSKIEKVVQEKKALNPKILLVVGIGGSNLGAMAIQQSVFGRFFNQSNDLDVFYADTVDASYISNMLSIVETSLSEGKEILVNVVSKSGKTTETIVNFEVILEVLKKYKVNYKKNIVITTDENSPLWKYGIDNSIQVLEIPKNIGGRYSVFSSVGIFPLSIMNINIKEVLEGAQNAQEDFLLKKDSISALRASLIYSAYLQNFLTHDLFVFSKDLEHYNYWYRQLMAESIGKEYDLDGYRVEIGITPTMSIGSIDLHSVAQLYLADKIKRFTTFIKIENSKKEIKIPNLKDLSSLAPDVDGLNLSQLMNIIADGVQEAYKAKDRPFSVFDIEEITPKVMGYLMQTNMLEISMLGYLLNINPFDQPNVELYKKEVRKILKARNE